MRAFEERLHPRNRAGEFIDKGFSHEALREVYNGFEAKGLTIRMTSGRAYPGGNYGELNGRIDAHGQLGVGEVKYQWLRQGDKLIVKHEFIRLDPAYQRRGWAAAHEQHVEDAYRKLGVDRIELTAAAVGAYTWATQGYIFAEPKLRWWPLLHGRAHNADDDLTDKIAEHAGPEVVRELETFIREDAEFEWQIAMWGRDRAWVDERGRVMWPGKAYLLGNGWFAVKEL